MNEELVEWVARYRCPYTAHCGKCADPNPFKCEHFGWARQFLSALPSAPGVLTVESMLFYPTGKWLLPFTEVPGPGTYTILPGAGK